MSRPVHGTNIPGIAAHDVMTPGTRIHVRILAGIAMGAALIWSPARCQMPPNPLLLQKLERGEMRVPYVLQHIDELRRSGVDAPWSSRSGSKGALLQSTTPVRTLGPATPPTGTWRALVILVQFSDQPAQASGASFDTLIFGAGPGSMRAYFKAVSYGSLDIVTANLPGTLGWITAPHPYAYYVDDKSGMGAYPRNAQKMVEDVVAAVDSAVDFSLYDNDHDGYVDALFIVHTGPGAELTGSGSDIWSHSSQTITPQLHDNVYVSRYSTEPEYWQQPGDMTIGVYAHELGHAAFGLPDLYDVDYSSKGLGRWSLMSYGSWNGAPPGGGSPALPDAWCRMQMGYVAPVNVTANTPGQPIHDVETNAEIFRLWKDGNAGSEYFLVENRQRTGFDAALPGDGLLIYHVDQAVATENQQEWYPGHTSGGHYAVALEQADGLWQMEKGVSTGDAADPYPGSTGNRLFSSTSVPGSRDYLSGITGVAVRNISASGATMVADFEVSVSDTLLFVTSPNGGERWQIGTTKTITWFASHVSSLNIDYSTNGGAGWSNIAAAAPASSGQFNWTLPASPSSACLIRVTDGSRPALSDVSDATFAISAGVTAEQEPNNTSAQAGFITFGDSIDAAIESVSDVDYFAFSAAAQDTVVVFAGERNGSALDGELRLFNSAGTLLASNDDYGSALQSKIVYTVQSSGTYYIRYSYYGNSSGFPGSPKGISARRSKAAGNAVSSVTATSGDYLLVLEKFRPTAPDVLWGYAANTSWDHTGLVGSVSPNGKPAVVEFEYGPTTAYGKTAAADRNPLFGFSPLAVDVSRVQGLQAGQTYHFRLVATNDAGTTRSEDYIFTTPPAPDGWSDRISGTSTALLDVSFPTLTVGTAVGAAGTILRTSDGGFSWDPQTSGVISSLYGVSFADLNHGMAVGDGGTVLHTSDGGNAWEVASAPTSSTLMDVACTDALHATAVGYNGTIVRTTDGGAGWQSANSGTLQPLYAVAMKNSGHGLAVGAAGTVLSTTDGGATWRSVAAGTSSTLWSVAFPDDDNAFTVGDNGTVLRSTDGGNSWFGQNSGTVTTLLDISCADANVAVAAGYSGAIVATSDGGSTWTAVSSGTFNGLMAVSLTTAHDGTIVGDYGTILQTDAALPVQLTSFIAIPTPEGSVQLQWSTASETNNYGYQVQRSAGNGAEYSDLSNGFVAGHGTSAERHTYTFVDAAAIPNATYRLKQIDLDGKFRYSEQIVVAQPSDIRPGATPTDYGLAQNYPNPFNPSTTISFTLPRSTRIRLELFNPVGEKVATLLDEVRPSGAGEVRLDASRLPSGVYFYRMQAGAFTRTLKCMVVK